MMMPFGGLDPETATLYWVALVVLLVPECVLGVGWLMASFFERVAGAWRLVAALGHALAGLLPGYHTR